ncbi:hypothetical protein GCM10009007_17190 [Formosimonas limnophila]|uniref:DUF3025 domain-containing protein n=1 Tax=Formosimonas limnophila TaxID=1384487 RepID=A0A8J3CI46_9BURK|nr:DUF3025 domain-containing protein [Formosimonas limnophila]GHA76766.1 hypothetical protein GCM10009007_17190 [Formosimonas limnophila]
MSDTNLPESEQSTIDWQAPWLKHLPLEACDWAQSPDLIESLNHATKGVLQSGSGQTLTFIPQTDLPDGEAYEAHIYRTGGVPTRLNLHDFFNACIWLTFPKTKAVLNARQAEQIATLGVQHERGVARDALTLFDENAAILMTSNTRISDALRQFDWHNALVSTRSLWDNPFQPNPSAQAALYPFGHALLEKLTAPYKAICTHTWVVSVEANWFALPLPERLRDLDRRLAKQLTHISLNPRDFCPLPVLGVPHFWADNADQTFYNDARVFRAGRTRLSATPQH